jgi:hypothetical protein
VGTVRDKTVYVVWRQVCKRVNAMLVRYVHPPAKNPYNRLNTMVLALFVAASITQTSDPARKPHGIITRWDAG